MGYVKSFRSIVKINEGKTPNFIKNNVGVLQVSRAEQYQDPKYVDLIKQMKYFENTSGLNIGKHSDGFELFAMLIAAQLKEHGIEVGEVEGYTDKLEKVVKEFQQKKGLPATGMVDHETYNVLFGGTANSSEKKYTKSAKSEDDVIPEDQYNKLVAMVIDELEGGYYHPIMMKKDPKKFKESVYGKSGETMFGLDRHAGHDLYYSTPRPQKERRDVFVNLPYIESGAYQYASDEARDFWTTIDNADAKNKWEYSHRGGSLEPKLRRLAGLIMKPGFNKFFTKYLHKDAQQIVKSDERLLFHFIYASWNGIKFWQKFADEINDAVEKGVLNPDALYRIAIEARRNSAVPESAEVMEKIFGKAKAHRSMRIGD